MNAIATCNLFEKGFKKLEKEKEKETVVDRCDEYRLSFLRVRQGDVQRRSDRNEIPRG